MITARYFFDSSTALGTVSYIPITGCPAIEVLINDSITFGSTMPCLAALKAELMPTFTLYLVATLPLAYESSTVRPGAPAKIGIQVDINVLLELQILFEYFLRPKLSNILPCIFGSTSLISTFYFVYFTVCNVEIQIVILAIQTKTMSTLLYSMHIFF